MTTLRTRTRSKASSGACHIRACSSAGGRLGSRFGDAQRIPPASAACTAVCLERRGAWACWSPRGGARGGTRSEKRWRGGADRAGPANLCTLGCFMLPTLRFSCPDHPQPLALLALTQMLTRSGRRSAAASRRRASSTTTCASSWPGAGQRVSQDGAAEVAPQGPNQAEAPVVQDLASSCQLCGVRSAGSRWRVVVASMKSQQRRQQA